MKKMILAAMEILIALLATGCMTYPYENYLPDEYDLLGSRVVVLSISGDDEDVFVARMTEQALIESGDFDVITTKEIQAAFPAYPAAIAQEIPWADTVTDWWIGSEELDTVLNIASALDADYALVIDGFYGLYKTRLGTNISTIMVNSSGNIVDVASNEVIGYTRDQLSRGQLNIPTDDAQGITDVLVELGADVGERTINILLNRWSDDKHMPGDDFPWAQ